MPKSKYPEQIDTSAEIQAVRDNITEIGSDVINSLRSAIFAVQKTLGTNPQGSVGNTVAARLNSALDENGNILKTALDRANVLSGPVTDIDISKSAAIQESKLKLQYPTTLLQSEITILNSQIETIQSLLSQVVAELSAHLNVNATNRHVSTAISVAAATNQGSDIAATSLEEGSVQSTFEEFYNSHIGYTGTDISETNNSHSAKQIFYDNDSTSQFVTHTDVQGAIEDLANIGTVGIKDTILNFNSNGRIRSGRLVDNYEGNAVGSQLIPSSTVTYPVLLGASKTTFAFSSPQVPTSEVDRFDILTITGSLQEEDNKSYLIDEISVDGGGNVVSVTVFGSPTTDSTGNVSGAITKKQISTLNVNGLNCGVRPRIDRSNTPDVQIADPNSATIISSEIQPNQISATQNTFDITIDAGSTTTISTYDSSVSVQTIDSILNKINEQAVDNNLSFMAYKLRAANCYELAIAHIIPNFSGDVANRTIQISAGSSNDGTVTLGLSAVLGKEVEGSYGNAFHINGNLLKSLSGILTFNNTLVSLSTGANSIASNGLSFIEYGIRTGDQVFISGADVSTDDGMRRISQATSNTIEIDDLSLSFSGSLSETSTVYVIRNSVPIEEMSFEEVVSLDGSILFDTFVSDDSGLHYNKRLEVDGNLSSGPFTGGITDVSGGFILDGETATVTVNTLGYATLTGPDLQVGEPVLVSSTGTYRLYSADKFSFVVLQTLASGPPVGSQTITLIGFDEIPRSVLHLSRGTFSTSLGVVLGEGTSVGIPALIDKRISGTVGVANISADVIEKYIEGPRNELRSDGVIRGLGVSNVTAVTGGYTFDFSAGVPYVNGIRFENPGAIGFKAIVADNFYIVVDSAGCILAQEEIDDPDSPGDTISPFRDQSVAHLAYVDVGTIVITDLRFFIDHLDQKVLGDIIVAPEQSFGHFTDIAQAVAYAKHHRKIYDGVGTPTIFIQEGEYSISSTITVDFDLIIRGAGPNTILNRSGSLLTGIAPSGGQYILSNSMFLIGTSADTASADIIHGVWFRDFTYKSNNHSDAAIAIAITQDLTTSPKASFKFENISFRGPTTLDSASSITHPAIVLTQTSGPGDIPTGITMGNLIVSKCLFDFMGTETKIVHPVMDATSTLKNISGIGNIVQNCQPVLTGSDLELIYTSGFLTEGIAANILNAGIEDAITNSVTPSGSNPFSTLNDLTYTLGFDIVFTISSSTIRTGGGVLISNGTVYRAQASELEVTTADTLIEGGTVSNDTWYYIYLGPGASPGAVPDIALSASAPQSLGEHPSNSSYKFISSVYVKNGGNFRGFIKRGSFVKITDFGSDQSNLFTALFTAIGFPIAGFQTISFNTTMPETAISIELNVKAKIDTTFGILGKYITVSVASGNYSISSAIVIGAVSADPSLTYRFVEYQFETTLGQSVTATGFQDIRFEMDDIDFDSVNRVLLMGYAEGRSSASDTFWQ